MEKKLVKLNLRLLKNPEAGELIKRLLADLATLPPMMPTDESYQKFLTLLNECHQAYEKCLHKVQTNPDTQPVEDADEKRDSSLRAYRKMVNAQLHAIDPSDAEKARIMSLLLNAYKGIEKDNYESESQSIDKLVLDLQSAPYAGIATQLKLTAYVAQINSTNQAFKQLFGSRITIDALKDVKNASLGRQKMMAVYLQLVQYLQAMANISDMGYYDQLLSLTNGGRKYFADMLAHRNGLKKIAAASAAAPIN